MPFARPLSMTAQAAWQDLLVMLRDDGVGELRGTPKSKAVGRRTYWFDQYRVGDKVVEKYIGEDTEALRERMTRLRELREQTRERERERSRLVKLLKSEGLLAPDLSTGRLVSAMARAGAFRLGAVIVGTQAFRHYEGFIGVRMGLQDAVTTRDIDPAAFERLSMVLEQTGGRADPDLATVFRDLEFEAVPTLDHGSVWRWRQVRQDLRVEFLTPSFDAEETVRRLPALNVGAQSLHFLNYLLRSPVPAPMLYRAGVLIRVPRPERYAVHKLIVADRRREGPDSPKGRKDRAQADFLIAHLADENPHGLIDVFDEAMEEGPRWRAHIQASLDRMPAAATALERARQGFGGD